ncbi:hypothetical protein C0033_03420 [Clostridium sp. chh4-2]|uniref:CdaR family protein n=1 Tax=Clostridium sp. chh4-2 TaxID=2067550 RepID=UPI000CCF46EC|nr:CdaR family protein [Clostridium sp. chh4-2]PNV63710.1 hypothetical protein C0033_03420 [Clostridium sp. chh4-2]
MKERLTNNLGLKVLSIFLAFFVWLIVVNVSNPVVQRSKEVTVDVINENVLSAKQLTYEIVGKSKVTVSYEVRTRDAYKISTSDFHVYADLAELYDVTGSIPLKIEVTNESARSLLEGTPTTNPVVIRVETEGIQRKRFDLKANITGTQEYGYAVGTEVLTPDFVYVNGPESQIGQISSIGIPIDIDNANADVEGTAKPVFYDANGKELELGDKVTLSRNEISYQVPILKVKNLNLDFEIQGEVAEGYRYTGAEASLNNVSVVGLKSALASYSTIVIPKEELDITGLTADKTVEVDLTKYLPEGIIMIGDNKTVTITLKVEALQNRNIRLDLSEVAKTGESEDRTYTYSRTFVDVTVRGLSEDLDSLTAADLNASLDLENLTDGTHAGMITFQTGAAYEVMSYSEFDITVSSKDGDETPEDETSEGSTESESTSTAQNEE